MTSSMPSPVTPHIHQHPLSRVARWSGFLLGFFCVWLAARSAYAQKAQQIYLLAPSSTYTQGKDLTAYVFFFRIPERTAAALTRRGFFRRNRPRILRGNKDFKLKKRKRLSVFREYGRTARGFMTEVYTMLYRLELTPRRNQGKLTYGPLKIGNLSSNILQLSPQTASQGDVIRASTRRLTPKARQGQRLDVEYRFRCPRTLCDYQQIDMNDLLLHLRQNATLQGLEGLWQSQAQVTPEVKEGAQNATVDITYNYRFRPLQGGRITLPTLQVPIPFTKQEDMRPIRKRLLRWVQSNHRVGAGRARQMIQLRQEIQTRVKFQQITTPQKTLTVAPAQAALGTWTLRSRLVTPAQSNTFYWEVSLKGQGFLLLANQFLRQTLQQTLRKHGLAQKIPLAHILWRAPKEDLHRDVSIAYLFQLPGKRPTLPAISMSFQDNTGKITTQTQDAILSGARVTPLEEDFQDQKSRRKIYIYVDRAPSPQQSEQVEVWTYRLPEQFPTRSLLEQRWSLREGLTLTATRKIKRYTRRSQSGSAMNMMMMQFSRDIPVQVNVGTATAQQQEGPLSRVFPTMVWGEQRVDVHIESGRGLQMTAQTERKRYFVGESIEYRLTLRCPAGECTTQSAGFYKKIFQRNLKMPSFDRFSGWRKLDDFTRKEHPDNTTTFTYRVRFKADQVGELNLKATTLRLPERLLRRLHQKHRICLFRGGRAEQRLVDAIARDHMNLKDGDRCAVGTQELESPGLKLSLEQLPPEAKDIKLIGLFRLQAKLSQLSYPAKQATVVDKPFYLLVDITGDGDLRTAQQLIQDQLARLSRKLRKQDITTYTEVPSEEQSQGRVRVQLQLIAEQPTTLKIPSLTLKTYQRDEGILSAQTLPLTVKIEKRERGGPVRVAQRKAPTPRKTQPSLLQDNELRPNKVLTRAFVGQTFSPWQWRSLSLLLLSPLLLLLFGIWQRQEQKRQADPDRIRQQKALSQARQALKDVAQHERWQRDVLQILQTYLSDRLRLRQKHLTVSEATEQLRRHWPDAAQHQDAQKLLEMFEELEETLYGGGQLDTPEAWKRSLEQVLRRFDRACPQARQ